MAIAACGGTPDLGGSSSLSQQGAPNSGSGDTTTVKSGDSDGTASDLCVNTINEYRKTLGLSDYARWSDAESCSSDEAASDSQSGKAHGAFGACKESAQNECPGWGGPPETMITDCLKAMWKEGPGGGHYENMRSGKYTKVACGFAVLPNGDVWAVQNFR